MERQGLSQRRALQARGDLPVPGDLGHRFRTPPPRSGFQFPDHSHQERRHRRGDAQRSGRLPQLRRRTSGSRRGDRIPIVLSPARSGDVSICRSLSAGRGSLRHRACERARKEPGDAAGAIQGRHPRRAKLSLAGAKHDRRWLVHRHPYRRRPDDGQGRPRLGLRSSRIGWDAVWRTRIPHGASSGRRGCLAASPDGRRSSAASPFCHPIRQGAVPHSLSEWHLPAVRRPQRCLHSWRLRQQPPSLHQRPHRRPQRWNAVRNDLQPDRRISRTRGFSEGRSRRVHGGGPGPSRRNGGAEVLEPGRDTSG